MKSYSTFNQSCHDQTKQPMFFGETPNVARYDEQKYPLFEKLIERQLSYFWRPEEIDLSMDRRDFQRMPDHERHIFLSNLKYQILLDSVQGRSPNMALLPVVSIPELETWVETWSFFETIHSRSYTHIVRNLIPNPSVVFDDITINPEIIARARTVTSLYDQFIHYIIQTQAGNIRFDLAEAYQKLIPLLVSIFILEGVRFYVSFACSFAFGERKTMEGNAKIIKLIARDEALHKQGTQQMIGRIRTGSEGKLAQEIYHDLMTNKVLESMFDQADEQECAWADYLFKDGSLLGMNASILKQYQRFISGGCRRQIGLKSNLPTENPLPWMTGWLRSDSVQAAPQEVETGTYLTGQVHNDLGESGGFAGFKL